MTNCNEKARHVATFVSLAWDARRAEGEGQAGIERRQRDRLQDLVAFAQAHSAYLANLYRGLPSPLTDVRQLPTVTKAEMMFHFDDWVTDPDVKRKDAEAFIADPRLVGHDYLNRYVVCTTSGATGIPAIFLHDKNALTIYNALGYIRSLPVTLLSWPNLGALLRGRGRLAAVS